MTPDRQRDGPFGPIQSWTPWGTRSLFSRLVSSVPRQAMRPEKCGCVSGNSCRRTKDHAPSAPIKASTDFAVDDDTGGRGAEVVHGTTEAQFNVGMRDDRAEQCRLQIGAMHQPVGCVIAGAAEWQADHFAAAARGHDAHTGRRRGHGAQGAVAGRGRLVCGSHWARAAVRRRLLQAVRSSHR